MPYKDPKSEKARETARKRMRRYRQRKKKTITVQNAGNKEIEITIHSPQGHIDVEAMPQEIQATLNQLIELFQSADDEKVNEITELLIQIEKKKVQKSKNPFRAVEFIPDLLALHLDLKLLHQRGGTA